jgi:ABC-type sugar transport system permease subunit
MFNKQKKPFWQLTSVFAVIVVVVLALSWGYRTGNVAQMNHTMADMMKDEHLGNTTIRDLFTFEAEDSTEAPTTDNNSEHTGHHEQNSRLYATHIVTTALLVLSLPIIVAGSIFLAIAWPKPNPRRN